MPHEATLAQIGSGLAPTTDGWFVVNAREAAWLRHESFGLECPFEANGPVVRGREGVERQSFPQIGINLCVLQPGQPSTLYHAEPSQEDFLVLQGECLAVIEEQERRLRAWDFVHCPPGTAHTFIGAGDGPCLVLCVGARIGDRGVRYFASSLAASHGAAVTEETDSGAEAYAPYGHWRNEGPPNPAGL